MAAARALDGASHLCGMSSANAWQQSLEAAVDWMMRRGQQVWLEGIMQHAEAHSATLRRRARSGMLEDATRRQAVAPHWRTQGLYGVRTLQGVRY